MRFRHIFSETASGLRQNLTMTLAVIMTMWVSLSLFGAGLLANQQVTLMKGKWYSKIEISVFLCTADTRGDNCEPGQASTLEVEVRSSVIHTITPRKIHDWLNGGAKTPKEAVMKERLRAML